MQQGRQGLLNMASVCKIIGVYKKPHMIWAVSEGGSLWGWGRW